MNKKLTFFDKAIAKFGNKYDYSKVEYVNSTTKVLIKCNKHDSEFEQIPSEHLRGKNGCLLCRRNTNYNTESFTKKANEIHNNKYDYSKLIYKGINDNINVICPEHGEFSIIANNHVNSKQGCSKCGIEKRSKSKTLTLNKFLEKAKLIHGDKYDYSKVNYINNDTKVIIICLKHGEFEQIPSGHFRGKGCQKCATENTKNKLVLTNDEFIEKSNKVHNNFYDYSLVNYVNSHTKIKIKCPEHGEFEQMPYDHLTGHGCSKCISTISKQETEVNTYINSLGVQTITSSRSIISPNQLDIFIPSHNLAIEFDGLYWHSEEYIDKDYHLNKTNLCEKKGIQLIHIFEDEWLFKQDIVKSRLKNMLGLTKDKIYARKTEIKEVNYNDAKLFLDMNHIQGNVGSSIRVGLYYEDKLVSLMTFGNARDSEVSMKNGIYDLNRFCNKLNTNVIGGADKLLQYFIKTYSPKEILSYADRRWSQGKLYDKLGFKLNHINEPNYTYIFGKDRRHKSNYKKHILVKKGYDPTKSEHEIMLERKIYRIYDCGTMCYKMKL